MKCPSCGIPVPEMPEDADYEETLCDTCYEKLIDQIMKEPPKPPKKE